LGFGAAGFAAGGFSAAVTIDESPTAIIARISSVLDIFDFKLFISQSPKLNKDFPFTCARLHFRVHLLTELNMI